MTLNAQKRRFPFIVVAAMAIGCTLGCVWSVLYAANSSYRLVQAAGVLILILAALYFLAMDFRKVQSVELTEEGVSALVWRKPFLWPKLNKIFFRWDEVERVEERANLIYLHCSQYRVAVNTLLFKDANEVLMFINSATKR